MDACLSLSLSLSFALSLSLSLSLSLWCASVSAFCPRPRLVLNRFSAVTAALGPGSAPFAAGATMYRALLFLCTWAWHAQAHGHGGSFGGVGIEGLEFRCVCSSGLHAAHTQRFVNVGLLRFSRVEL